MLGVSSHFILKKTPYSEASGDNCHVAFLRPVTVLVFA